MLLKRYICGGTESSTDWNNLFYQCGINYSIRWNFLFQLGNISCSKLMEQLIPLLKLAVPIDGTRYFTVYYTESPTTVWLCRPAI